MSKNNYIKIAQSITSTKLIKVLRNKLTPLQIVITNGYTCSIFQVAKIAKKGVWLCSLFFKTIFRLIIDEVCICYSLFIKCPFVP